MGKDYKNYLRFLAAEYNVLYIGEYSEQSFDEVLKFFKSSGKKNLNELELDNISLTLSKYDINLVIIDAKDNDRVTNDFYKAIRIYNEDIPIMLIFNPKKYKKLFEIVPLVDITVSRPMNTKLFYKRLFTVLSAPYTVKSISRRDMVLKQENVKEEDIEEFFDTYQGSSIFISDDLADMVESLNNGELSKKLFKRIAKKLDEISDIFLKSKETSSVSPIYKELSTFLTEIDLNKIEPQNLKGFDYLSEILNDVSVYLLDMFVDRIFKDVYVFEHSLKSNIKFMENTILGNNEDEGELDFF